MIYNIVIKGILLGISVAAPIGPVNLAIINRGLKNGFTSALITGVGAISADLIYLLLISVGMLKFLMHKWVNTFLWGAGAVVLFYLAYGIFKNVSNTTIDFDVKFCRKASSQLLSTYLSGFAITFTSPMTIVFWASLGGAMISDLGSAELNIYILTYISILTGLMLWIVIVSVLCSWGRRFISTKLFKVISLISCIIILGFSFKFGYQAVSSLIKIFE